MTDLMTRRALLPVLLLALSGSWRCPPASADEPLRLRVLSYNIHHGEGIDGKLDLERIARVINAVEPDIAALQEVDRKTQRTGAIDQPAELARLTGMDGVFGGNIPYQGGDYGNAVLSRMPMKQIANHPLSSIDHGEQRGVLEVEIELPGDRPRLRFLATHLDARPDHRERLASAREINELIKQSPRRWALLAGDLNATPESEPLRIFETTWSRANAEVLPTIPTRQPTRQIDFILFRPMNGWKVVEMKVLDESVASDHRAIFAVLEPPAAVER